MFSNDDYPFTLEPRCIIKDITMFYIIKWLMSFTLEPRCIINDIPKFYVFFMVSDFYTRAYGILLQTLQCFMFSIYISMNNQMWSIQYDSI